jgi:hypothetical protein
MKFGWKYKTGALALSVAMLSMSATAQVAVKGQSGVITPPINVAPATTKNKCHGPGCHMQDGSAVTESAKNKTGTIPVENDVANPATERGIKDPGVRSCGNCGLTGKEAAPPPVDDGAAPPSAEWETGQIRDKGKPQRPPATERRAHSGPGGTPPSTAKKGAKPAG